MQDRRTASNRGSREPNSEGLILGRVRHMRAVCSSCCVRFRSPWRDMGLKKFLKEVQRNTSKQEVTFGISQTGSALVVSICF